MKILHILLKLFFHFAFLALLWIYCTVLTPASPATFLCHLTWFSLCFHIFLEKVFGADVLKTIFSPLIQYLMYVQTISCTKRITASIIFFFGVFTLPLSHMKHSSYSFQMEINLTRQKFPFFLWNLMSSSFGDKFTTLKLEWSGPYYRYFVWCPWGGTRNVVPEFSLFSFWALQSANCFFSILWR